MSERLEIERPIHTRELEQRLDLGSKNEHARSHCNEQWFLAKGIPSQHEPLRVRIPERPGRAKSTSREACVPCGVREGHAPVGLLLVLSSTLQRSARPSINDIAERRGNCFG